MAGRWIRDWAVMYVRQASVDLPEAAIWLQWVAKKKAAGKENGGAAAREGVKADRRYLPAGRTGLVWMTEWKAKRYVEDGFGVAHGVRMVHRDDVPESALRRRKRRSRISGESR